MIELSLQNRDSQTGHIDTQPTATVGVDRWNWHWCKTATERGGALVPRMERCLQAARALGIQIFYCPTDVVEAYVGTPQRERVLAMPLMPLPALQQVDIPTPPHGSGCTCGQEI